MTISGTLSANGGDGGAAADNSKKNGGGGGGGRITIYYSHSINTSDMTDSVDQGNPGRGDGTGQSGELGTIFIKKNLGLSPAMQWLSSHSGKCDPTPSDWSTDYDGDGMRAKFEYALGGNPGTDDQDILPNLTLSGQHFSFNRRISVINPTDYEVQTSATLGDLSWIPLTPDETMTITHPTLSGFQKVFVPVPQGDTKRFVRLVIK